MIVLFLILLFVLLTASPSLAGEIKTVKDVVYGRAGGHDLIMHITETDDGAGFKPAMVCIHGGSWARGNPEAMLGMAAEVARMGFKCFSIQYRLTGEAPWPAQIEDCKRAVRHIRANARKYDIDPNRIGAFGHSAGGHLACLLGTLKPGEYEGEEHPAVSSLVQGVVSYCGPETFDYEDEATVAALFDSTPEGREYWLREASPITHASRTSAPHLIIHGAADDLVPWQPGEVYRDALRKSGARAG